MDNAKRYFKTILNIIIPLIQIFLICFCGLKAVKFFMPFVIGWIVACIANPLVRFLEKKVKLLRKHSSAIIIIAVILLIVGLLYFAISKFVVELSALIKVLPDLYKSVGFETKKILERFSNIIQILPPNIRNSANLISNNIGNYMSLLMQKIASPTVEVAGQMAKSLPNVLVNMIIMILSAYFFTADRDNIVMKVKSYIPKSISKYMVYLKKDIKTLIVGYFLAQFKIMIVIMAILEVGFLILGVHYSLMLSFLIAFLDFLPVFGTGTAIVPWAVFSLLSGKYAFGVGLLLLYVLTQLIRRILEPKLIGDSFGISPLFALFLLFIGFKFKGIAGMIMAVPIGMLILNFYKYGAFDGIIENAKLLYQDIDSFRKK